MPKEVYFWEKYCKLIFLDFSKNCDFCLIRYTLHTKIACFFEIFVFYWLLTINILHYHLIHVQKNSFLWAILQIDFPHFVQKLRFLPLERSFLEFFGQIKNSIQSFSVFCAVIYTHGTTTLTRAVLNFQLDHPMTPLLIVSMYF